MLTATNIHVTLGKKSILHGINFTAKPGEITAIVGPNGSGKTTLLRALTNDIPFDGIVTLGQRNIETMKPWELATKRAVLSQSTPLAFPFTVYEVVRLGLNSGIDGGRSQLPEKALAAVDLIGFSGRYFQELSGGEQQRVQLARVLCQIWDPIKAGEPRWLFLDEPVASLDIGHQLMVMQLAHDYAKAGGGVIAVMHDLNLTAMFADNVALIQSGKIVGQGTPKMVLTEALLSQAYGCSLRVNTVPSGESTFLLPHVALLTKSSPVFKRAMK